MRQIGPNTICLFQANLIDPAAPLGINVKPHRFTAIGIYDAYKKARARWPRVFEVQRVRRSGK